MAPPAPSFPWRRNLYVLWLLQAMTPMGFTFTFSFFPLFFQELGVGDAARAALWNGLSGWVFGAAMAVFGPFWGIMGDRFGRRRNLVRATLMAGIILLPAGFAQTPMHLVLVRFLTGAMAGVSATIMALVGASTPRRHLAFALGLMQSALFVGTTIGPLIGGLLFDNFGMRAAFYATGSMLLFSALLAFTLVREEFHRPKSPPGRPASSFQPLIDLWRLATSRRMLPVLAVIFIGNLTQMVVIPVLPLIVATLREGTNIATASGVMLTAIGATSAVSSVVTGRITSSLDIRLVFIVWCSIAAALYIPAYFADSYLQLTILVAAVGLFQGGIAGSANALMAQASPPDKYGSSFGAAQSAIALALAFGPLTGGLLAVTLGLRSVFLMATVLFAITAVVAATFLRVQRTPDDAQQEG